MFKDEIFEWRELIQSEPEQFWTCLIMNHCRGSWPNEPYESKQYFFCELSLLSTILTILGIDFWILSLQIFFLKFRYSEKAKIFDIIFPFFWRYLVVSKERGRLFQILATFSEYLDFICKNGCRNIFSRSGFNEEVIDVDKKIIYCAISCEIKSSSLSQAPEMHSFQSYNW